VRNGRSAVATPNREEPPKESRWSARKKADAVVRLLRGESLDELSRETLAWMKGGSQHPLLGRAGHRWARAN
jgi:hypothetical protein